MKPAAAPNGSPWPASAAYIERYERLNTNGLSSVKVDNSRNQTDAFVKLVSVDASRPLPVRVFFIPRGGSFTADDVRAGTYDIRYQDLDTGELLRSESFGLAERTTLGGVEYSTVTITLYKIRNGNISTYPLAAADF